MSVGSLTHTLVEETEAFEAGAVHDHRGLPHEGRVAQQASKRFRRLEVPLLAERPLAHGNAV
jgi:hypothetical protein